ncbi:AraC family transcriptional regulator [Saccharomonospora saliphila]|uniref:AraC family transcriptional regulator n=1 Tax=Saccharomonospora saliphila TaxID=369829 RepID=UPI000362218A|nr:helix-turn-helix domain-containing protein [Saccharomonospora saliphila]
MRRTPGHYVRAPDPALRRVVTRYIGYAGYPPASTVHRGLPTGHATLVVSLDDPVPLVGMPRADRAPVTARGLVGGLALAPVLIGRDRPQAGVQVQLEPLGLRALLGVGAAELCEDVVALGDLGAPGLALLADQVAEAPDWPSTFAAVDAALRAHLREVAEPPPEVGWAWQRLTRSAGTVRVEALAREVGWSRRHLADRFRAATGVSPKQAARILRFERAGRLLRQDRRIDLAGLAVACGYSDQAHLSHEWRTLAGCSPRTWLTEELPDLREGARP